jgi:hypothetical protein
MKIFNVSLRLVISQIGEIPDLPAEAEPAEKKPFNDDPVDKQEGVMSRYLDRIEKMMMMIGGPALVAFGQEPAGASMSENVRIAAANFEDLQAVLRKFSDTINALPAAPESLLASIQGGQPPARGRGAWG